MKYHKWNFINGNAPRVANIFGAEEWHCLKVLIAEITSCQKFI